MNKSSVKLPSSLRVHNILNLQLRKTVFLCLPPLSLSSTNENSFCNRSWRLQQRQVQFMQQKVDNKSCLQENALDWWEKKMSFLKEIKVKWEIFWSNKSYEVFFIEDLTFEKCESYSTKFRPRFESLKVFFFHSFSCVFFANLLFFSGKKFDSFVDNDQVTCNVNTRWHEENCYSQKNTKILDGNWR